jgi:electron transfer flavoprotein beta subunit
MSFSITVPTKVKKIENVVFTAKETKKMEGTTKEINGLIKEMIENHTIG